MRGLITICLAAVLFGTGSIRASTVIDQQCDGSGSSGNIGWPINGMGSRGQEFTPTMDNIVGVAIPIYADYLNMRPGEIQPITVKIRQDTITGSILATSTILPNADEIIEQIKNGPYYVWLYFDFGSEIPLTAGNRYVIDISTPATGALSWMLLVWEYNYNIMLGFRTYSVPEVYSGGTGEPNNPYRISTVADWQELMAAPDDWDKHFVLAADIDLAGVSLMPVGNTFKPNFAGVFDGNGHIIRNAVINMPHVGREYIGLFGCVDPCGQIKNIGVEDANISGMNPAGILVGRNFGSVTNCYATGSVSGQGFDGGLVGWNYGTVTSCYASGSVTGAYEVGGLVGENNGSVTACHATNLVSAISDYSCTGGLVGRNWNGGSVTSCYATGAVSGLSAGGLVGQNWYGSVNSCYATGAVSGEGAGGLMGRNEFGSVVTSCYATGAVSGLDASGLIGLNAGSVDSCYATGAVSRWDECQDVVYGLVGINYGSVAVSFWDTNTSGCSTSDGGIGKTTAEMKTLATFTSAGWDFVNVWKIKENIEYPHLIWENATPIACIVGGNQIIEAQGPHSEDVRLDGSCSSDSDSTPGTNDDINDFNWYEVYPWPFDNKYLLGTGEIIDRDLPFGKHTIVLEVTDKAGATDSKEITVTVQDTTPPEFELSVTPTVLWPANNKMMKVTVTRFARDLTDGKGGTNSTLVGITVNEPADADDIQIINKGLIYLRAAKDRIYTITYQACDDSGNCTIRSATVTVPHDNRK